MRRLLLLAGAAAAAALPVLPITTATAPWPAPGAGGAYFGDIRAVLSVAPGDVVGGVATAQIFWRRRDPVPSNKAVYVLDANQQAVPVTDLTVESICGVVSFTVATPPPAGGTSTFYVYYLPFVQTSGGADTHFHWQGCNSTAPDESNPCVLGRRLAAGGASACDAATPASALVLGLENRDGFHGYTRMEMVAAPAELAAVGAALSAAGLAFGVFPEAHSDPVRDFGATAVPARWALAAAPATPSFAAAAAPGVFFTFQLGLYAFAGPLAGVTVDFGSGLTGPAGTPPVPASAMNAFNLGGVDPEGKPFTTVLNVSAGAVASLWLGVALPADASAQGAYTGVVTVSAASGGPAVPVPVTLTLAGAVVPDDGAGDPTLLARLSWLDSTIGLEDVVPAPFVPVGAVGGGGAGALSVTALNKVLAIGANGFPTSITVTAPKVRRGAPVSVTRALLRGAVAFDLLDASGAVLPATVTAPAAVTARTNSTVSWAAASSVAGSGGSLSVSVAGELTFSSYVSFVVTLACAPGGGACAFNDTRLSVPVDAGTARYVVGMGQRGAAYRDVQWTWRNSTATNKLWLGRVDAGIMLNLKGEGDAWNSPMFGADFPVVPFVPPSWGGAAALPTGNPYGCACANATMVTSSGPRVLAPGASVRFLFDLALTPSKVLDSAKHFRQRTVQVGYGTDYISPQDVRARNATIVTLHQGVPGIINGSLVNPYINYPFSMPLQDPVPFMASYVAQANELGMTAKFYYTIRELSNHANELFAFAALNGEIMLQQDPYIVVQPGYSHDWDSHGGSAYLHEHLVENYAGCWQQNLADGEWDAAVCTHGVSRLFNFYVRGLQWSVSRAPFINGIYYDGINFQASSMVRIRRAADAAAAAINSAFPPLLDLHTGEDPSPPAVSYATHYPFMDSVWNGEGFDFGLGPEYWLIEVSSQQHGLSGDRLGGSVADDFKGMLFGMTRRNSGEASAFWGQLWDATAINESVPIGFWEDDSPVNLTYTCGSLGGAAPPAAAVAPSCPTWNVTTNGYFSAGSPCGDPNGNTACFTDLTVAEAEAACCADPACGGFSYVGTGGCYKTSQTCWTPAAGAFGYWKPGWTPPPNPDTTRVLATAYVTYQRRAVVVLASWCPAATSVTVAYDWAALGLGPGQVRVSAPAIAGVQAGATFPSASGPFTVPGGAGLILLIEGQAAAA